jgi:ribonuclease HI
MAKSKPKFYVVWKGHNPGIYSSWDACQQQISGYTGALFKSFPSKPEAEIAFQQSPTAHITPNKPKTDSPASNKCNKSIIKPSLSVDAACSGNPGMMEYQGVNTESGEVIFHQGPFAEGTNNIGEFLAIVHALALLQKKNRPEIPIYTDSITAISWVKKKKCNTKLPQDAQNKPLFDLIIKAEKWLYENTWRNPIIKWETEFWGEIPADFGRK